MATRYVDSNATGAGTGADWANAYTTLAAAAAADTAGDTIFVAHNHSESTGSAVTLAWAGTITAPTRVLCVNTGTGALAKTAVMTTTSSYIINTGDAYIYGVSFVSATTVSCNDGIASAGQHFSNCVMYSTNVGSGGDIGLGGAANASFRTILSECVFRLTATSQFVTTVGTSVIEGGSFHASTTTPTSIFRLANDRTGSRLTVSGFDFSNLSSTVHLFAASSATDALGVLRDCKLPASWTGSLCATSPPAGPGQRYELHNCDSGDTNYRLWIEDYTGSIKQDTGVYLDGGVTDGTTALSYKFASSANCNFLSGRLYGPEMHIWNDTTGSSKTVTVEIVHDSQGAGTGGAMQDDQIWLEVMYLGTSGVPLGTWISDAKADVLATAADQASSSATWTGDAAGWDTQKLSVTMTPQEKGVIVARVVMGVASKTVYVDPNVTVT